ncbi:MAG: hypothetical protein NZ789_20080 [Pseudomonadales bacterium]|nr:hypothetical protein [Pseudomonadales bacterium]
MRKVTDRFAVSREKLAYVVDSTAAPICVLIPVSTWAVFFAGVLETSQVAEPGEGMTLFVSTIPYMLYPWVAVLLVPLVAIGRIPALGLMRTADANAAARAMNVDEDDSLLVETEDNDRVRTYHFLLPIIALLGCSLWYDLDVQLGVIVVAAVDGLG